MRRAITLAVAKDGKCTLITGPEVPVSHQRNAVRTAKPGSGIVRHEVWIEGQKAKSFDFKAEAEAKAAHKDNPKFAEPK